VGDLLAVRVVALMVLAEEEGEEGAESFAFAWAFASTTARFDPMGATVAARASLRVETEAEAEEAEEAEDLSMSSRANSSKSAISSPMEDLGVLKAIPTALPAVMELLEPFSSSNSILVRHNDGSFDLVDARR